MKVEEIEKLLTAFYEGSTTENQEEILKAYFGTEHIPERRTRGTSFLSELLWRENTPRGSLTAGRATNSYHRCQRRRGSTLLSSQ